MRGVVSSSTQQRRVERLAREAGRTTEQMLKFVLRDGLDYCEWQVAHSLAAEAQAKWLGTTSHEVVMREARELIEAARVRRRRHRD